MKKLLIALALPLWAIQAYGQTYTTFGATNPESIDAGYFSDYSTNGTIVLTGGSVTLANGSTYEHGNNLLQNDGSWNALSGSLDLFLGAANSTISGNTAPSFFNVHFNNGAGNTMAITNAQGIVVTNTAQFSNGITTTVRNNTNAGSVHFNDNATYTGGITDVQHVNGYVSKTGDDAFTFPVGSGTDARTLSVSAPATITDQYSVAWIAGDPGSNGDPSNANALHPTSSFTAPISSVSKQGQWDWIPVSGTGAGLTITVSLPAGVNTATALDLRLVGWNGTSWIDLSGSATATGNTEGSLLSGTMVTGITAIGIGSTTTALPVTFGSFDVQKRDCAAALNWTVFTEHDNDYFAVERSQDGRSFSRIGKVDAVGNSGISHTYSYYDRSPSNGMNYYRIVQVDIGGQSTSTAVRSLRFDCDRRTIEVYPTVTQGIVYVSLPAGYEQAKIILIGINGQQVAADITQEGLSRTVRLPSLAAGTYLLKVDRNGETETFKILYQP
jgi:hypothetical protein